MRKVIISVILIFCAVYLTMAKGTLTGYVTDEEFNEPLEKAVVTIRGTLISVLTDQQGKFTMDMVSGNYVLEVNFPGYFAKYYNISVTEGIATPMFVIRLKTNMAGRTMQRKISIWENKRIFPHSIEDFSIWQISEQNGHQEFNQLMRTIPSVTFLSNGNGYGDSELGFRGNDPTKTTYTFNGILLNNPETGRVGTSTLSGLTDWAGKIQVVNGQAANLQSQTNSGGLINVLSYVPRQKAGTDIIVAFGNEGFLKTSATVHSGLSKKGLISTVQVSRTSGNGLAQNTAFAQYGFFVNIQKELNRVHSLFLNLNGIFQQHDRNGSDSIGAYNLYGTIYNKQWGTLNQKPMSWSTNYGRSPLICLTHSWQYRPKTIIKTQLYAQFNGSAQLKSGGLYNNQSLDVLPRDSGLISFEKIIDWNKGLIVSEMGSVRQTGTNGKFTNSEYSGITTLASIDRSYRLGLRSVVTHNFSKEFDFSGSIDFEQYQASHFGAVCDLLGADNYTSFSDFNRPEGFDIENLFQAKLLPSFNSADKTGYYYKAGLQSGGLSVRLNYQTSRLLWYLEGVSSLKNYRRIDYFNYLITDPDRKTKSIKPGGRVQTGVKIHFWKYHSIQLKTSYGSYQPLFSVLFPSGNNWANKQAPNEQIFDAEFGYTIFSRKLKIEALAYRSQVTNRSMVRRYNLNPGDSYGLANGLDELLQGVELKTAYKITRNIQLHLNGSLGEWKYMKDATAHIFDSNTQSFTSNDLWIKDVRIANAPQLSLFAEAEWRWAHNFYVRLNYYRADQVYAPFSLYDFKNLADRVDFNQWKLPVYELIGASGNYLIKLGKTQTLNLIFGAQNLLDTEYIEQSATNLIRENQLYTSNQVYYGSGRTWFAGIKLQF